MSVSGKKTKELNYGLEINTQLFVVYDERIYFILFQKSSTVWTKKLSHVSGLTRDPYVLILA